MGRLIRQATTVVGLSVSTVLLLLYFNPGTCTSSPPASALIVGIAFMDWAPRTTVGS